MAASTSSSVGITQESYTNYRLSSEETQTLTNILSDLETSKTIEKWKALKEAITVNESLQMRIDQLCQDIIDTKNKIDTLESALKNLKNKISQEKSLLETLQTVSMLTHKMGQLGTYLLALGIFSQLTPYGLIATPILGLITFLGGTLQNTTTSQLQIKSDIENFPQIPDFNLEQISKDFKPKLKEEGWFQATIKLSKEFEKPVEKFRILNRLITILETNEKNYAMLTEIHKIVTNLWKQASEYINEAKKAVEGKAPSETLRSFFKDLCENFDPRAYKKAKME